MNTIVCVKQVWDIRASIKVEDGKPVQREPGPVKVINSRDVAALEEAMRLKELYGGEVTAISLDDEEVGSTLYHCLARGVDRAIHLFYTGAEGLDDLSLSTSIGRAIRGLDYDLILCGDRSQDEGRGCMAAFLADFLGCPQVTKVVKLEVSPEQKAATVWRQLERGWREEMECQLPAVMGVERTTLEPKYVSLFSRSSASARPLQHLDAETGEGQGNSLKVIEVTPPRPRTKKTFVPDASLSPEERFQFLISGGTPKKNSDIVEGETVKVAKEVAEFLKREGFLTPE